MPYRKRYRKKKRSKQPWYERKYTASQLAKKAWKTAKWLKSVVNVEKKLQDNTVSTSLSSSPGVTHLTNIQQGSGQGQRDGTSLKLTSLFVQGQMVMNASATSTLIRLVWVIDNQQVGDTTPNYTDIYEAANTLAPLNKNTLGRFTVLKDMRIPFSPNGTTNKVFEFYMPLNHHVRYNGTASTDIQKGGLYLVTISNEPTNTPTIDIRNRVRFVDN